VQAEVCKCRKRGDGVGNRSRELSSEQIEVCKCRQLFDFQWNVTSDAASIDPSRACMKTFNMCAAACARISVAERAQKSYGQ